MKSFTLIVLLYFSHLTFVLASLQVESSLKNQVVILSGNLFDYSSDGGAKNEIDEILSHISSNINLYLLITESGGGHEFLFFHLLEKLKVKNKNLTIVIAGSCASSCTYIAPMSNQTLAVESLAKLKVHRTFADIEGAVWINSVENQIKEYISYGANDLWFKKNKHIFLEDNSLYTLNKRQALQSGLVDEYVPLGTLPKNIQNIILAH